MAIYSKVSLKEVEAVLLIYVNVFFDFNTKFLMFK